MISFVLPLAFFILSNMTTVLITKKSFGKVLPLTMMLSSLTLFLTQVLFHTFFIGFIVNIFLAIVPIIYIIISKHKKKDLKEFKSNCLTPGLYAFIFIYIGVFIFDFNRHFTVWDEYSHWGVMVKEMLRLDKFYSVNASTLMVHKDYPPIISIFEMFYCKLIGAYKEPYLITSLHLFSLSFFIPALSEKSLKSKKLEFIIKITLIMLSIFLTFLLFDGHGILNTIYTDYTLAVIVSYMLYIIVTEKNITSNFSVIVLSISSCFLLLTKQMGLPLYLMVLFIYALENILKKKLYTLKNIKKINYIKFLKILILLIIIPLFIWKGWSNYIQALNIKGQFELGDLNILEIKDMLTKTKGKDYQHEVIDKYPVALINKKISTSYIKLTYVSCVFLMIIIFLVESIFMKKSIEKRKFIEIIVTLFLGSIGYAFVMFILYLFSFGEIEGPNLASFNRYMPTFIFIWLSLALMLFFYYNKQKDHSGQVLKKMLLLTICLLLLQNPKNIKKLTPKVKPTPENLYEYHAKKISEKTDENAKIFLIVQNTAGDYQYAIKYYMNPRITNLSNYNFPQELTDYQEYFEKYIKDYMLEFDYLYIVNIEENIKNKYDFFFKDNHLETEKVYKIINNKSKIKLEEVF